MNCTRYFDAYLNGLAKHPEKVALGGKKSGVWKTYTYSQLEEESLSLSNGLLKLGLEKEDKVITISGNKPESFIIDFAVTQIGGIHVPIYPNYNSDDFSFVIEQCEPKIVFVSGLVIFKMVNKILKELGLSSKVVLIDGKSETTLKELQEIPTLEEKQTIYKLRENVKPEDIYSIYYTSGTGGGPKGAVYTHGSISMIDYIGEVIQASESDISLSYLPMSHAYERPHIFTMLNIGASVYFATSTASIIENLQEIKPSFMTTVPVLIEKVLDGIKAKTNSIPEGKQEAYLGLIDEAVSQDISLFYKNSSKIAVHPFAEKWREILGGKLRLIGSAGAPLSNAVNQFYHAIGIPVLECYGLTEVAMGTYNIMPSKVKCGSVGLAARGVEIKLSPIDNEILIKSPFVTKEIYKIPVLTKDLADNEGYFRTGDIGEIDEEGFIFIKGRKKELFKLQNGRYFTSVPVENLLKQSPLIENVIIYEEAGSIVCVINPAQAENEDLTEEETERRLWKEIHTLHNDTVLEVERINELIVDYSVWSIENGKLTPTMKVKRFKVINN
ncbi:MAG: long-chain acyl-CoA synthetase [Salibacteraceae bacterium]|jgi:long-chain acyl-CoA synthetase